MDDPKSTETNPITEMDVASGKRAGEKPESASPVRGSTTGESQKSRYTQDTGDAGGLTGMIDPPLSKNQLKKLKRRQQWEDAREDRKRRRKEQRHSKQARKRAEREAKIAEAEAAGLDPEKVLNADKPTKHKRHLVPVSLVIDCDFEEYMREPELVSLASQITRCYSQNRNGQYQTHLFMSSWKGQLKTRYETVMNNQELMAGPKGGSIIALLQMDANGPAPEPATKTGADPAPIPEPESTSASPSVVYLTSDSPYTLERLEPYTSYIIGGLVDRNREKSLCYKRALAKDVRTAKLPIGDYMVMASRQVLTTNQVVEIMSKWLECGNWGTAFTNVIPKRKGGRLKVEGNDEAEDDEVYDEASSDENDGGEHRAHQDDADIPVLPATTTEEKAEGLNEAPMRSD
jgi:tRNA (guanine9-N1)-methyltransferase